MSIKISLTSEECGYVKRVLRDYAYNTLIPEIVDLGMPRRVKKKALSGDCAYCKFIQKRIADSKAWEPHRKAIAGKLKEAISKTRGKSSVRVGLTPKEAGYLKRDFARGYPDRYWFTKRVQTKIKDCDCPACAYFKKEEQLGKERSAKTRTLMKKLKK